MRSARCFLWLVALAGARCSSPDEPPSPARFACERADEAPLPDEAGGVRCLRVGAREGLRGDAWPDVAGVTEPVVYVQPDAPAGGDGSRARPFRTLAEANGAGAATVALSRGEHRVTETLTLAAQSIVGVDPSASVVRLSAGASLVAPSTQALRRVSLRGPTAGTTPRDVPLSATRGATLTLEDVVVDGGHDGVATQDATLVARRLTVRHTTRRGLSLSGSGWALLDALLVREGVGAGVVADGVRVSVHGALVAGQGGAGVTLLGAASDTSGTMDCAALDPRGVPGPFDCLQELAVIDGHSVGVWVRGARGAELQRLLIARTRPTADDESADGIYVSDGADVRVDPGIASDAMQGRGTVLADNARAGLVVDGGGEMAARRSRLTLQGARVEANAFGGVFAQNYAVVPRVAYSRFVGNGGVGLAAVPSVSIASIACNGFIATRPATLLATTDTGERVRLPVADGLSLARASDVQIIENAFDSNGRFAALFVGSSGRVSGNRGEGNRYGLGVYDGAALDVAASNRGLGREPAPSVLPGVVTR